MSVRLAIAGIGNCANALVQGITHYYDQALKRELSKSLPLANGPGPGVVVVRAAITAVSSKTESLKPYELIPVALVAAAVSTASGIRDQETLGWSCCCGGLARHSESVCAAKLRCIIPRTVLTAPTGRSANTATSFRSK